jgi:hypothetical protein
MNKKLILIFLAPLIVLILLWITGVMSGLVAGSLAVIYEIGVSIYLAWKEEK